MSGQGLKQEDEAIAQSRQERFGGLDQGGGGTEGKRSSDSEYILKVDAVCCWMGREAGKKQRNST